MASDRVPEGAASLAAIELGVDDERRCAHCGAGGAVSQGKARGLRRLRCKACGRIFGALTGTALSGLHHKERWLSFGASLAEGETIKASAAREQVPILVAADRGGETLSHTLPALNADKVQAVLEPVLAPDALLVSDANRCYPPVAAALDIPHESINASAGERVRGAVHIQTVNSRHSQIKGFQRRRRGIATKYLDSYLRWFHLIALGDQPSPRACLEAAMTKPRLRFAN